MILTKSLHFFLISPNILISSTSFSALDFKKIALLNIPSSARVSTLTVIIDLSPGIIGFSEYSTERHPQDASACNITNGFFPVFVTSKATFS